MLAYQFETHSQATNFLREYYLNMRGYRLFEPSVAGGVFAVACIHDNIILTLLDNRTIQKSSGRIRDCGLFTKADYELSLSELSDITLVLAQ